MVYEEHGKLGIPLYCVCDPKEEGGGAPRPPRRRQPPVLRRSALHVDAPRLTLLLLCVCCLSRPAGCVGWGLWADPCKITFTIKPMYENSQQPEKITLSFGGKEDRDRVFRLLTRALHDKPWQPAPAVGVPAAAPPVQRAAPVAATPPAVAEPAPPPADPDGIFVVLPHAAEGPLGGGEAATVPVCPPRCGFEYDFTVERKYVDSSR